MKNRNLFIYIGLFLLVTGGFYFVFDKLLPVGIKKNEQVSVNEAENVEEVKTGFLSFDGPKTEVCPINGFKYTTEERNIWETRRPLLIMIENHQEARPQSGLNTADVVYEAIAEGGITRFMAVYYCDATRVGDIKYDVGPVRSARSYFLDVASEYSDYPLYTHVGGANCSAPKDPTTGMVAGPCTSDKRTQAVEQIASYGWNNKGTWSDLSQFSLSYKACRREPERTGQTRATEHTMYCSTKELWKVAEERGLTNKTSVNNKNWDSGFIKWSFDEDGSSTSGTETEMVSLDFWGYEPYKVSWEYDANKKEYVRLNGSEKQLDFNDDEEIRAKNIVIQLVTEDANVDEHKHNVYEMIGTGKGVLVQNGKRIDITWSKRQRQGRTIFRDTTGKEIKFVPGKTWVEILSKNSKINYATGNQTQADSRI